MKIVAKYNSEGCYFPSNHDVVLMSFRGDADGLLYEAKRADLIVLKTVEDYKVVQGLHTPKIFYLCTDDPNAFRWGAYDEVFADPSVKAVFADTPLVLWHWRVPKRLAWVVPKAVKFIKSAPWKPTVQRIVLLANAIPSRGWHMGQKVLEAVASEIPVTLFGRENAGVKNVEIAGEIKHANVSQTVARYYGTFLPYVFSASPCWMMEAMLQGMPIVSNNFDFARRYIPESIAYSVKEAVGALKAMLKDPTQFLSYEEPANYFFNQEHVASRMDTILGSILS